MVQKYLLSVAVLAALGGGVLTAVPVAADNAQMSVIEQGRQIAFDRKLGNCLACHMIEGGKSPGNIGPPLVGIQGRFPDKAKLRDQIYDASINNPNTVMPPYGKHRILTEEQIDKVVEFIYTL